MISRQLQQQNNFLEFTMIIYVLVIGLSVVYNHTSDAKVGRLRSGSPISLSRVRLQTELDKVFLSINHKNNNFQEKKTARLRKKRKKICIKRLANEA